MLIETAEDSNPKLVTCTALSGFQIKLIPLILVKKDIPFIQTLIENMSLGIISSDISPTESRSEDRSTG